MTIVRRRRNATAILLGELDRLAGTGNPHAANMAAEIREGGDQATRRLLTVAAGHVVDCQLWATHDAVIRAFAQYEKATTGIDWRAAPPEQVRARVLDSRLSAMPARALARQQASISKAHDRQAHQRLVALRAAATGQTPKGPGVVLLAPGPRIPMPAEESARSRRTAPTQRTAPTFRRPETRRNR